MRRRLTTVPAIVLIMITAFPALAGAELCPPPALQGGADPVDLCGRVYRIRGQPGDRLLTGFGANVAGVPGIVTALHGVIGCNRISGFNLTQDFSDLQIRKVNVRLDAAFLTSARLSGGTAFGLVKSPDFAGTDLRVVGYPQGLQYQLSHSVGVQVRPLVHLKELLPPSILLELEKRKSPHPEEIVLSLTGSVQNGYSGAPVLAEQGGVVAVVNGGLGGGTLNIGWAIPYGNITWQEPGDYQSDLNRLAGVGSGTLFGASSDLPGTSVAVYLADAGDPIGRIYKYENGVLSEFYKRSRGQIYSVAVSPDGSVYFSDANDKYLYRLQAGRELPVYTHTTYLRHVRLDSIGRLYFSEATGAGGDGTVYRLEGGTAYPYYQVRLAEVGGFWAGNFGFDKDGFLWLSSGNRVPANLYKVVEFKPQRVFTSAGSISGFCFTTDGDLLYTDWRQTLYRLSTQGVGATRVQSFGLIRWLSDAAPIAGP